MGKRIIGSVKKPDELTGSGRQDDGLSECCYQRKTVLASRVRKLWSIGASGNEEFKRHLGCKEHGFRGSALIAVASLSKFQAAVTYMAQWLLRVGKPGMILGVLCLYA